MSSNQNKNRNPKQTENTEKEESAKDLYVFTNPAEQLRFTKIISELRCSVCQNQTLADSMAPLAVDLRQTIYQKIKSNESEQQIVEFVSSRYGEFMLYRPPLQWDTAVLWFAPVLLLFIGFLWLKGSFGVKS